MKTREQIREESERRGKLVPSEWKTVAVQLDDLIEILLDIRDINTSIAVWGIYCPQHYGSWHRKHDGQIYVYPTKEVAEAHIETILIDPASEKHLWKAVEFGKQTYIDPYKVAEGKSAGEVIEICPTRHPSHYTEGY